MEKERPHKEHPTGWHKDTPAGNVMLADCHVEFFTAQTVTNLTW